MYRAVILLTWEHDMNVIASLSLIRENVYHYSKTFSCYMALADELILVDLYWQKHYEGFLHLFSVWYPKQTL